MRPSLTPGRGDPDRRVGDADVPIGVIPVPPEGRVMGVYCGRFLDPRAFGRRELGLVEGDGLLGVGWGEDFDEFRGDQSSE